MLSAIACGAFTAAAPWVLTAMDSPRAELPVIGWFTIYGAVGGLVGYGVARGMGSENSLKPAQSRGKA